MKNYLYYFAPEIELERLNAIDVITASDEQLDDSPENQTQGFNSIYNWNS